MYLDLTTCSDLSSSDDVYRSIYYNLASGLIGDVPEDIQIGYNFSEKSYYTDNGKGGDKVIIELYKPIQYVDRCGK